MKLTVVAFALIALFVVAGGWRWTAAAAPGGRAPASQPQPRPDLGVEADMRGFRPFPNDDPWNSDISKSPVDPNSDAIVRNIGADKPLHLDPSIPYVVVGKDQRKLEIKFTSGSQSWDKGPYPIPPNAPIEGRGAGDAHVLCIDRDAQILYELFHAKQIRGGWQSDYGAIFDLKIQSMQRAAGRTSADAAGLPIFAGLARCDEVVGRRKIEHALRFTVEKTRRDWVPPATHQAGCSDDKSFPPMGMRARLKASYDISRFPMQAQVILVCLKTYGLMLADNGSDWYVTAAPDSRWDPNAVRALGQVRGRDFEVVQMDDPAADQK